MRRDAQLEKKHPHTSHVGRIAGTKGEEAQVLWKDAEDHDKSATQK